ncbi:MAG: prolyl oligopeptidase family serine peptidase [Gemmatimonadales bacterium]
MPTRFLRPLLALLVLAAAPLSAQTGLTAVQAAAIKRLSNVAISPDGRTVAYVVTVPNLEESSENSDIWLVPAAGGGAPWRLTNAKESDESPAWSPDGQWIAFRSARAGAPQLYRIAVRGGEAEQLTTLKKPIQAFAWSPDGKAIAFVVERADTPDEEKKQQGKDDAIEVDRNFKAATLHVLDVESRKVTDLTTGDYQIVDLAWAPDSRRLAFVSMPTPRADDARYADIHVADLGSGAVRRLLDNAGPDTDPAWSPDGSTIAFRTRGPQAVSVTQNRLATISAGGGTLRMLGSGFLYEPGAPVWSPDGKTLMFWALTRTSSELYATPVAGGPVRQLSKLEGSLGLFGAGTPSISADGSVIAFARGTIETPDEVYTARLGGDWTMEALTRLNPELATVPMGRSEIVRWKSKDGMEVEGIVVYPVGYQQGRRYPTVAIIHGGPSGVWDRSFPANWYNSAQVYAGQGWVSSLPNPRGSSGYGEKFLAANYRDWGNGDYQDIQTGLDYLIQRGIADLARLAQTGWSHGGYDRRHR